MEPRLLRPWRQVQVWQSLHGADLCTPRASHCMHGPPGLQRSARQRGLQGILPPFLCREAAAVQRCGVTAGTEVHNVWEEAGDSRVTGKFPLFGLEHCAHWGLLLCQCCQYHMNNRSASAQGPRSCRYQHKECWFISQCHVLSCPQDPEFGGLSDASIHQLCRRHKADAKDTRKGFALGP